MVTTNSKIYYININVALKFGRREERGEAYDIGDI